MSVLSCRTKADLNGGKSSPREGNRYAERFSVIKHEGYSELTLINPFQGAKNENYRWILLNRDTTIDERADSSSVIKVPVQKLVCMSTTWLSMLKSLGCKNLIKGISGRNLVFDSELRAMMDSGDIRDVGFEDNLNKELIVAISPDVILNYGIGGESSGYVSKIREMGYKVVFLGDYLEREPLARVEWIKVLGLLIGKEKQADSLFSIIERRYNEIRDSVKNFSTVRPSVLLGLPWKDTWYVSPGNSFVSKMIEDAGGNYIWRETVSDVSMPYGLENVYLKAMKADFWFNTGAAESLNDIISVDPRLGQLPPFISGRVYNNNSRISFSGANDYWESGTMNPHIILRDLASVLHPELFNCDSLYYYKRLK
jgi:iron complex transport system substrate-binding protein